MFSEGDRERTPSGHSPHELTNYRGKRTRSSPMAISAFRTEILAYRTKSSFAMNEVSIDLKADKQTFLGDLCRTDIDRLSEFNLKQTSDNTKYSKILEILLYLVIEIKTKNLFISVWKAPTLNFDTVNEIYNFHCNLLLAEGRKGWGCCDNLWNLARVLNSLEPSRISFYFHIGLNVGQGKRDVGLYRVVSRRDRMEKGKEK
ncbi:hypothetical protein V1478_012010 [Vespula squamosa]|uniref:Uncharacterized protein n=1 Tax=Vespula squamosa TaxID=30214 RepID=A0ABD2AC02_VESSQ